MSKDILTGWLENSNGGYFTPKTFDTLVFMKAASDAQGKLVDLPTYFQEAIFDREIKIDLSHNNTCAFGSMEDGSWPGVTGILGTANGGTGNADGYIRTGANTATADPGDYSTIEGYSNTGSGKYSHSENANNVASGEGSHAQGFFTVAEGYGSHSGGFMSEATGQYSFTHGSSTIASGQLSFAIGKGSQARGKNAFAAGNATIARGDNSFVIGEYNIEDTGSTYSFIVGNGNSSAQSNAFTIDWDGNAFVKTRLTAADITITNGLSVTDIEVGNDLIVSNDASIGGKTTIAKQLTVSSEGANIIGPTFITGALGVSDGAFTTTDDASIGGDLNVTGTTYLIGLLTAIGGISAQAPSTFDDTVTIGKDLTVSASASIDQGLTVNGDATISGYIANATWNGQVISTAYGGTGVSSITANAIVCGGGINNPIVEIQAPGSLNYFLVSGPADNPAPSYQRLDFAETHDGEKYNLTLKLGNASAAFDTIVINGANTTSAGLVTTGAQTFAGNKTFANNVSVEGVIEIASVNSDLLPEEGTYMLGSHDRPWQDVFAWGVAADDITSAFGGLRIANGTDQITIQDNEINLTSSQINLDCGTLTLSSSSYGYQLPETGVEGQVFFLLLED